MPSHMLYETHSFSKIFWPIFCVLTFYRKIQCVSAFLSQNPMRSFHAIILSQNQMRFCTSIAKSNAFFSCLLICSMKLTPFQKQPLIFWSIFCDLTFYRKILCIFAFLSKNPMRSFHTKSQTFWSKSRTLWSKSQIFWSQSQTFRSKFLIFWSKSRRSALRSLTFRSKSQRFWSKSRIFTSNSQTFWSKSQTFHSRSRTIRSKSQTFQSNQAFPSKS